MCEYSDRYAPVGVPDSSPEHDACKAEIERMEENAKGIAEDNWRLLLENERLRALLVPFAAMWEQNFAFPEWHSVEINTEDFRKAFEALASRGGGA